MTEEMTYAGGWDRDDQLFSAAVQWIIDCPTMSCRWIDPQIDVLQCTDRQSICRSYNF